MFTGIIEELGEVVTFDRTGEGATLTIRGPVAVSDASLGDSIAVNGVCLTVTELGPDTFTTFAMGVTLEVSALSDLSPGDPVNLERALGATARLGGHLVQGHVDGTAEVLDVCQEGDWRVLRFALASDLAPLVARKGSIAVHGVSLTVSNLSDAAEPAQWFEVSLIPETLERTTLGRIRTGDRVNLETDVLARHVLRLREFAAKEGK